MAGTAGRADDDAAGPRPVASMSGPRAGPDGGGHDLTIGLVGPHDLVERIMLSTVGRPRGLVRDHDGVPDRSEAGPGRRMVAAAYRDEQEAADKVARLAPVVDAWLFASPVPLALVRAAGVLSAPTATIPLGGSALYAALLRAVRAGVGDLSRSSVDGVSRDEVADALAELAVPADGVHVSDALGAAELASFHHQLWRGGQASAAFTCLPSAAVRLAAAGVPVYPVRPTGSAIRAGLRTAELLGINRRLGQAQLAVIAAEVPVLRDTPRRAMARSGREEIRLTVHRFLVQQARQIGAVVSPAGEHGFVVTATMGALAALPGSPPFTGPALAELGIELDVGVGTGGDAEQAEARARAALHHGRREAPAARGSGGPGLVPVQRSRPSGLPASPRGLEILTRLAAVLPDQDAALVVDAETTGRLLGVTPRTARRLLHTLVEEGIAWPLPPSRTPQPGRPRQVYRLLVEKLQQQPADR